MEEVRDDEALRNETEPAGPAEPQEPPLPPSPPPPPSPSPPSPAAPEPEPPTEAGARQLLLDEWGPLGGGLQLPARLTWKLLLVRRPLYRNLLRSPNPEGARRTRGPALSPSARPPSGSFPAPAPLRLTCLYLSLFVPPALAHLRPSPSNPSIIGLPPPLPRV